FVTCHTKDCVTDAFTQAGVDHAKCACNHSGPAAAVLPNDLGEAENSQIHPVTAILGVSTAPITYMSPNTSGVIERNMSGDSSNIRKKNSVLIYLKSP